MPGYNFNHFTGKTKGKALRKKKVRINEVTKISMNNILITKKQGGE